MIVLDTSAIYAFYDRSDAWHSAVANLFEQNTRLILPSSVILEADYLLGKRLGQTARMALLEDLVLGVYEMLPIHTELLVNIQRLEQRYADLDLGFVDASIAVLATTIGCSQIATLDRRHFAALAREMQFTLLP
jgi:uncharacterized protein